MYTINAARQAYAADRLGSIGLGKVADLIVIDRNIFEVPITTVHETQVVMTIIDGEIVHEQARTLAATA
jgi:predicted amidohydrolase YtcJ